MNKLTFTKLATMSQEERGKKNTLKQQLMISLQI